ncbi:aspartate kinase homoserine dehydrogenase [Cantharellus anzutake]|uniref:aspartate kinase homoserine dehydrogenase n=1 Tax=Cantharellus anzutake TaxID=1750568 RepID=UPI001908BB02|nr:aspartate kinase homoserine dehydrogenase [Cantharellus anzutake]KAF8342881.1 aspartate kinase homoserine dehydrogenase [Cantharellus anzutake]
MPSPLTLAIIGTGLVGSKLISQIASLSSWNSKFKVVYIASSSRSIFAPQGIDLSSWKERLLAGPVVVVDNTSSDDVASLYPHFLSRNFSVVTPNKKAYSSSLELYNQILAASAKTGAKIFNESTVGAGLPIISTLKDLVQTGDKVTKIEGVLSGTLSYLFNEYSPATSLSPPKSFSSVVRIAKEQGYTEPHPADDLSGFDVARKLTILSRLIPELTNALPKGYESVSITSLIPDALKSTVWSISGDEFIKKLRDFDGEFEELRTKAAEKGEVLRYVGVIDVREKTIKAALEPYPATHPFATSLSGSDNIIAFHTERYGPRPLIVQGAGAGADVTAMGVLADLFKI